MGIDREALISAGINYDNGLRCFAGKEALYEKYLKKFMDDKLVDTAKEALKVSDFQGALEAMHALKGETGTLGMEKLYGLCQDVVTLIRNENYTIEDVAMIVSNINQEYECMKCAVKNALVE
ncbi:MAG: Hpt domain-containing protein [Lachnospiraceae bacterium]|nr:Hpt domain-containing protein [Lachnospiraceae bacterium]